MIGALSVALLFGLIGFAAHFLWIVSIIVMALALGFIVADSRRNRVDSGRDNDDDDTATTTAATTTTRSPDRH